MPTKLGVTAWGRAWLRTIESTSASTPNSLLPQARTLAANGSVALTTVEAGRIRAEVTVRGQMVLVGIDLPLWDRKESAAVRTLLTRVGERDRRVAAGEIPDSVVADLAGKGISVSGDVADHTTTCGCAGRRKPCVHHLAAVYRLVQQIDEEPALAVTLRERRSATAGRSVAGGTPDRIPLTEVDAASFYGE